MYNRLKKAQISEDPYIENNKGLEHVFPKGHELHDVIYYDRYEGKYYNRRTDMFLEDHEVKNFIRTAQIDPLDQAINDIEMSDPSQEITDTTDNQVSIENQNDDLDFDSVVELGTFLNSKMNKDGIVSTNDLSTLNQQFRNLVDEEGVDLVSKLLSEYFRTDVSQDEKSAILSKLFQLLPGGDEIQMDYKEAQSIIYNEIKEAEEEIKKLAYNNFNNIKTAQHKTLDNVVMWDANEKTIDPFLRQPVSDWHIVERNKGFGLVVEDKWNIDWETAWRNNVMDKYYRSYRDKDTGEWKGGYLERRFEVDKNIPEANNMQLKPGQIRKPYNARHGNIEARIQDMMKKEDRGYGPIHDNRELEKYDSKKTFKSSYNNLKKKIEAQIKPLDPIKPLGQDKEINPVYKCNKCNSQLGKNQLGQLCPNCNIGKVEIAYDEDGNNLYQNGPDQKGKGVIKPRENITVVASGEERRKEVNLKEIPTVKNTFLSSDDENVKYMIAPEFEDNRDEEEYDHIHDTMDALAIDG